MNAEVEAPEVKAAERIVMYQEQGKIEEFTQGVEVYADLVNNILTSFNSLNLGALTMEDIHQMAKGSITIKAIVQDRMVGNKAVKVGGLNLNLTQVKEMVQLPDLDEVEADVAVLKYRVDLDRKRGGYQLKPSLKDVAIVEGVAQFNPVLLTQLVDSHTCYATTDSEKELYNKMAKLQEELQHIADEYGFAPIAQGGLLSAFGQGSYGTAPYKISLDGQRLRRIMAEGSNN